MWHTITGTNKIFQNPGAKACSVTLCVDISPCISLSHNLYNWYLIISWSSVDYQLNYFLIGYLFIDSVTLSVLANSTKWLLSRNNGCSLNSKARGVYCLRMRVLIWCTRFLWAFTTHNMLQDLLWEFSTWHIYNAVNVLVTCSCLG